MSEQPEIRSERPSVTSEQPQGRSQESWVVSGPQVIDVDEVRSLRVQLVGGRVDVVDARRARRPHRGALRSTAGPLEVSLIDGELRVGYQFTLDGWEGFLEKFRNFRDKDRADVSIAVPRDLPTKVGTVSAEGLVAGIQAAGLGLDRLRLRRRRRHPGPPQGATASRARSSCATTPVTSRSTPSPGSSPPPVR